MAKNVRLAKINSEIQKEISNIISEKLNNPELENIIITISSVDTSADLYVAKVYVSILGDKNKKDRVMAILDNAKGFIRHELANGVKLRVVPDLVFLLDNSQDYSDNINKLLKQINKGK